MHRLDHARRSVAKDQRTPGREIVDVAIAVDILEVSPRTTGHEDRMRFKSCTWAALIAAADSAGLGDQRSFIHLPGFFAVAHLKPSVGFHVIERRSIDWVSLCLAGNGVNHASVAMMTRHSH